MTVRALQLDFQQQHRPLGWGNLMLLAGGLATTIALGLQTTRVMSALNVWEAKYARLEQAVAPPPAPKLSPQQEQLLQAEINQANDVVAHLSLPWERLFRDIESSPRNGVAMLAIEPDAAKHRVRITAEARNLDTMIAYLRRLQEKKSLVGVFLQSHLVERKSPEQPVHFVVTASWVTDQ